VVSGLVACIIGLALWPGLILHRADQSVSAQVASTHEQPPAQHLQPPTQVAER
jgi:hypothetical protein